MSARSSLATGLALGASAWVACSIVLLVATTCLGVLLLRACRRLHSRDGTEPQQMAGQPPPSDAEHALDILELAPLFVCMAGRDGMVQFLNASARQRLGIPLHQPLPPLSAMNLYAPSSRQRLVDEGLPAASRLGTWTGEVTIQPPGWTATESAARLLDLPQPFPAMQTIVTQRDATGRIIGWVTLTTDISEQKAARAQLVHGQLHDQLTGLPNRLLLQDRLSLALARTGRTKYQVGIIFVGIDHFRLVNESYGHPIGDELLRRAAARLVDAARPGDTVARFGGDRFCVLVEDVVDARDATAISERLRAAMSAPYELGEHGEKVFLTVSAGVAVSSGMPIPRLPGAQSAGAFNDEAQALLRDADSAMDRAKISGRARTEVYAEQLRDSAVLRLRTTTDLHRAIEERQFRLTFQPEVNLSTGRIVAMEALLRWDHPERGTIMPANFVPLAEETGLIEPIGAWVLEEALRHAAQWHRSRFDGRPLIIWVNISARQLSSPVLLETISALLRRYAVPPRQLGLEITETALPQDLNTAIATLGALRTLGVRLAIDDFGTGYSSLAYLKRLPVDAVKIDRAFVDGIGYDPDDSAIVSAILGVANALRLTTVAEGVETEVQVNALRRAGCEMGQGYFFSRPSTPADMERILTAGPPVQAGPVGATMVAPPER